MIDATALASLARGAGFYGDDLRTAVALALAATGGEPRYDVRAGMGGAGRWRGLWGINVDRYPRWDVDTIGRPDVAARAAYDLTRTHGGFDWSDTYRAGLHVAHLADAGVAATRETDGGHVHAPIAFMERARYRDLARSRYVGTFADTLTAAQHRRIR
jgi:hypothetical protein